MNKSSLAIYLSKLLPFEKPKVKLEQYSTESQIASDVLWNAFMLGDIKDKVISDYGAGTGTLGIGALELGAKKVYFVEIDVDVISILKSNTSKYSNFNIFQGDVDIFDKHSDTVIMNPPFGVKTRNADKRFIEKGFELSKVMYYMAKVESKKFINSISKDYGKRITHYWEYDFLLKNTMFFHKSKKRYIKVGCWRIE